MNMPHIYPQVRLGDVGQIITGKTPPTDNPLNYNGEIQFLTPSDDLSVKHIYKTKKTISKTGLLAVKNCLLPPSSIAVSCIGSDLGKVVITTKPTITNQQINSIIPSKEYDVDYIYYSLLQIGKLLNFISKTSTAVPIVNKSDFSKYTITAPPLPIQRTIAATLSSLDDKIELNNRINANLEAQAQAIFKSWFVDFEPFQDGEFVDSELGKIPKGWRVGRISEHVTVKDGTHDSPKQKPEGYKLITSKHLNSYSINFDEAYYIEKNDYDEINKRSKVDRYDILISMIGTVGIINYVLCEDVDFAVKNVGIFKTSQNLEVVEYLLFYLKSSYGVNHLLSNIAGSTQKFISLNELRNFPFLAPDEKIIKKFKTYVFLLLQEVHNIELESKTLAAIRDSLLPRLMSGEIEVPKEENHK
ncbi:type I restriction endonuclease MjaXP subunit S [Spirochaetia bacterium]|nr:type I restriction endonuclease MjaXP subunit S [Spirochaetia bacterium]